MLQCVIIGHGLKHGSVCMVVVHGNTHYEESRHLIQLRSALNIECQVTEMVMFQVHGKKVPHGDNISRIKETQGKAKEPVGYFSGTIGLRFTANVSKPENPAMITNYLLLN